MEITLASPSLCSRNRESSSSSQLKYFSIMSIVSLQTTATDFYEPKLVAISTLSTYAGDAIALFCVSEFGG